MSGGINETILALGYLGIFANIFAEIGLFLFPLPADSLLFSAGIFVESGRLSLSILLSIVISSSILAGHTGYFLGKKLGRERIKYNKFFSVDEVHLHRTERFFEKYGPLAIVLSRFIPMVRTFISPALGILGYDKYKFATYNAIASVIWAVTVVWLGMLVGKAFPNFIKYVEFIVLTAVALVLLPAVYSILKSVINKNKK